MSARTPNRPARLGWWLSLVALCALFLAGSNATVQAVVPHALRGRVMALYAMALLGTTPIGGPVAGLLGERFGPRIAIAIGGLAAVVTVAVAWAFLPLTDSAIAMLATCMLTTGAGATEMLVETGELLKPPPSVTTSVAT